jgi:hypothetical protein
MYIGVVYDFAIMEITTRMLAHIHVLCSGHDHSSSELYDISNNPRFRQKHPGVPNGSDGSDGTSYQLTENYTLPVAQATGHVA